MVHTLPLNKNVGREKNAGICPECKGGLEADSDYPNDLICGACRKVFDRETLEFVEQFE